MGTHFRYHRFNGYEIEYFRSRNNIDKARLLEYSVSDEEGMIWYIYKTNQRSKDKNNLFYSSKYTRIFNVDKYIEIYNPYSNKRVKFEDFLDTLGLEPKRVLCVKQNNSSVVVLFDDNTYLRYNSLNDWDIHQFKLNARVFDLNLYEDGSHHVLTKEGIIELSVEGKEVTRYSIDGQIIEIETDNFNNLWVCFNKNADLSIAQLKDGKLKQFNSIHYSRRSVENLNTFEVKEYGENWTLLRVMRNAYLIQPEGNLMELHNLIDRPTYTPISNIHVNNDKIFLGSDNGAFILKPEKSKFKTLYKGDTILNSMRGIVKTDSFFYSNSYTGIRYTTNVNNPEKLDYYLQNKYGKNAFLDEKTNKIWTPQHSKTIFTFDFNNLEAIDLNFDINTNNAFYLTRLRQNEQLLLLTKSNAYFIDENLNSNPFEPLNSFLGNNYKRQSRIFDFGSYIFLTSLNGLIKLSLINNELTEFNTTNSDIPSDKINFLYNQNDSLIWLASQDIGLIKWNHKRNTFSTVSKENGLSDNFIYSIHEDNLGRFWLPSNNGLNCYNPNNNSNIAFFQEDGISHNEFNRYSDFEDSDGTLYFGGLNGITYFHPDSIELNSINPTHLIVLEASTYNEDGKVRNVNFYEDKCIDLLRDEKGLSVRFATNDIHNAELASFSYRIVGYINEWQSQSSNEIILPKIPAGDYELEINFTKPGVLTTSNNFIIPIQVPKPFHKSTLFYFLVILGLIFLLWAYIKLRTRYLERRAKQLSKMVATKTEELKKANIKKDKLFWLLAHDLKGPLNALNNMNQKLNYLLRKNEIERAFNLSENVDKSVHSLNDNLNNIIQWALKDQKYDST